MPGSDAEMNGAEPPRRLIVEDMRATITEGMTGWLERYAKCRRDGTSVTGPAGGVILVATRLVESVREVCAAWNLAVAVRDGRPGWRVLTVRGSELPVRALCATVEALCYHAVTVP